MDSYYSLQQKIIDKTARIGIIGLGYVGKALLADILRAGYSVTGFTTSSAKAKKLNEHRNKKFLATSDNYLIKECDIILVCAQTPVDNNKKPDLSYVAKASSAIAGGLRTGQLVVIESSVAPGTTRNVVLPELQSAGLREETDYFLAASPERVDPGNKQYPINKIPKVLGGIGDKSAGLARLFYKQIVEKVVSVSSLEAAEFTKLYENSFRLINISFALQMREYTNALGLDIYEIINAAASKPFGFLPHYPGPGIGGHCIPVDPYYLLEGAKKHNINLTMIEQAGKINDNQVYNIVAAAYKILIPKNTSYEKEANDSHRYVRAGYADAHAMNIMRMEEYKKPYENIKGGRSKIGNANKRILLLGITYKPDIDDTRESPAIKVWKLLEQTGFKVSYHDPMVPSYLNRNSLPLHENNLNKQDLIILMTNHSHIDYQKLLLAHKPILDTRHVYSWNILPYVYHL